MSAHISYKLKNSLQGALAGGGDPATSPLYVFGPFLTLIVGAGVAEVTFGASIWLAVFTVVTVSAMYRYVMKWVTDGSGGSGLSEEEFGGWAVKINAAITVIEYTLTFLVSIAALVTFIADRFPILNAALFGISSRTLIAVGFTVFIAAAVNRGPKISAEFFGPATALILLFLWVMVGTVIWKEGLHFPDFKLAAFDSTHLNFTLGGFARILALMTGIEIFANLVASYEGNAAQRSRMAYGSLLIVMGTTVVTMLVVGPAILKISDPSDLTKSVFTQTMDALLPSWLSYAGTLIGIAVLLSAAAASAQGIQNLALGLRARHYIPASWGRRNEFDVPTFPAWAQAFIVIACFVSLGTHEETYLALYAAGVFVLLSMTGWSACKRFVRYYREIKNIESLVGIILTAFSAICATFATLIIFEERFFEGAWSYVLMVPLLYLVFDLYKKRLGAPPESIDSRLSSVINIRQLDVATNRLNLNYKIKNILVPMSGRLNSDISFYSALKIASDFGAIITPAHIVEKDKKNSTHQFIDNFVKNWSSESIKVDPCIIEGDIKNSLLELCESNKFDLICIASSKLNSINRLIADSMAYKVIYATTPPVLIFRPTDDWKSRSTAFRHILVPLDGSEIAEQVIPYVKAWANVYQSKITLLSIPDDIEADISPKLKEYLKELKSSYFNNSEQVDCIVDGSGAARTIMNYVKDLDCDLIAMVSHGRGGIKRQDFVKLGSVTNSVLTESDMPVLFISAREELPL
ncbi:MAG: universal stress protein [Bdellovibrionales bacterium]|nr:universal stress protein [Bdellovibrionales bacterium]